MKRKEPNSFVITMPSPTHSALARATGDTEPLALARATIGDTDPLASPHAGRVGVDGECWRGGVESACWRGGVLGDLIGDLSGLRSAAE